MMKRRMGGILLVILFYFTAFNPLSVMATSYMPDFFYHRQDAGENEIKAGQTAYLFHSGTEDIKKIIHVNDMLTVYRVSPACDLIKVGAIRVIDFVGDTYLKAEVVEGEIRPYDIAKKGNASCLAISVGICSP